MLMGSLPSPFNLHPAKRGTPYLQESMTSYRSIESFLGITYFNAAVLCNAALEEELRTALLALRSTLIAGHFHNFNTHRRNTFSAVTELSAEVRSAADETSSSFAELLVAKVFSSGSDQTGTAQDCSAASMRIFYSAKPDTAYTAARRVQKLHSHHRKVIRAISTQNICTPWESL